MSGSGVNGSSAKERRAGVLAAVDARMSRRATAERLRGGPVVGASPAAQDVERRSRRFEARSAEVMPVFEEGRDATPLERRERMAARGNPTSRSVPSPAFPRTGTTRQKRPATQSRGTVGTCRAGGAPASKPDPISSPSGPLSKTRYGRPRTLPAAEGGIGAAHDCGRDLPRAMAGSPRWWRASDRAERSRRTVPSMGTGSRPSSPTPGPWRVGRGTSASWTTSPAAHARRRAG
mgnify:CR=1 FL=1